MNKQTQQTEQQAKYARAWKKLRPGYNRVWLTAETIAAIEQLRASGEIDNDHSPSCVLGAMIYTRLEERGARTSRLSHLTSLIKEAA